MTLKRIDRLRKGGSFSARDQNALANAARTPGYADGVGFMDQDSGDLGMTLRDNRQPGVWVEITGGANPYAFQQIDTTQAPALPELDPASAPLIGTLDQDDDGNYVQTPAYEINGLTEVPIGTNVQIWLSDSQDYWLFDHETPAPYLTSVLGSGSGEGQCPIGAKSIPYLAGFLIENGYQLWFIEGQLQTYWDQTTGTVEICGGDFNEVFVGCLAPCGSGSGSGSGSGGSGGSGGGGVCATLTVEIDSPNCPSLNGTYSINGGANVGNTWYGQFTCPSQPASPCISSISFIPSGPVNAPTGGTLTIDIICPDGKSETVSITLSGTCCPLSIAGAGTINPQAGLVYCCSGATLNASVLDQCGGPSTPCNCPSQVPLELTITGGCTSANGTYSIPWAANNDGINTWLYEGGNTGGSIPPANPTVSAVAITCSPGGLNNSQLTYQYAVTIELSNGTYETFSGTLVVPCGTTSLSINIPGCGSGSGPSGECPQVGQTVSAAVSGPVGSGEYTLQVTSPTTSNYTNTNCNGNLSTGVDCLVTVQLNCGITGLGPYVDITGYCANGTSFTVDIPVTISGNTFSGSQSCPNINCGGGTCVNGTWTVSGSWS